MFMPGIYVKHISLYLSYLSVHIYSGIFCVTLESAYESQHLCELK